MIELHADDYGLQETQSKVLLTCIANRELSGISAFANSASFENLIRELVPFVSRKALNVTIHLNFIEGKCLADPSKVYKLVDTNNNLCCSFLKLVFISFLPPFSKLKVTVSRQLREEIHAQICRFRPYFESGEIPLRLDSHVHYHAVPIVFHALLDVLEEEKLCPEYIRLPFEDFRLYRKIRGKKPINLLKAFVLNSLLRIDYLSVKKRSLVIRNIVEESRKTVFSGVVLSGHMFYEDVKTVLSELDQRGIQDAEILFHPGTIPEDQLHSLTDSDDIRFWRSENRNEELHTLKKLCKCDSMRSN